MKPDPLPCLRSALNDRQPLPPDPSDTELVGIYDALMEIRGFLACLVQGDLTGSLSSRGHLCGQFKSLQANLRHLTWQAQRIAEGDFTQRIDFMGDFAVAFNSMTRQLQEARAELEEANRVLQHRADTDGLTGLYNHAFLMNTLEKETARASRYGSPLSLVMLDIDHFKKFNDNYGHQVGDAVLSEVAALLRSELRPSDTAGRYGGEEFMLILPGTGQEGACALAGRVRARIEASPFTAESLKVTVSGGAAQWNAEKITDFIQTADDRLYEAKRSGRNRIVG